MDAFRTTRQQYVEEICSICIDGTIINPSHTTRLVPVLNKSINRSTTHMLQSLVIICMVPYEYRDVRDLMNLSISCYHYQLVV